MARQKAVDTKIQVTRGFVTEFTPVGFPQEAAIDIDNCIIDVDGSVRRRPGIDVEQSFVLNSINGGVLAVGDIQTQAFSTHIWEFVNNEGNLNIIVQQLGTVLQFYSQLKAASSNFLGELDIATHAVTLASAALVPFEMASGLGSLFVVGEHIEPLKITYDGSTFTATEIVIQQRDFEGLDDVLDVDTRPTSLLRNHYYNLLNSGWSDPNINTFGGLATTTDLCAATPIGLGAVVDWPSKADIMTVGIVVNGSGNLVFDPSFLRNDFLGNTPAPKGHFILDAFNKDYATVSNCPGMGLVTSDSRPLAVAFHQGRVFYAAPGGVSDSSGVYYSQQLITDGREGKCFQEADPTASEINDLVATDGGFLPLPGVGQIHKLQEFGNGIIILASNGIWYMAGADVSSAISATNLRVEKLYPTGALSASSVVSAGRRLYYFGIEGIMQVGLTDTGAVAITNVTQTSIQQFYVSIAASARAQATVTYLAEQKKIYWAYRDTARDATQTLRNANRVLVLDLEVKGFYKFSVGEDAVGSFPEIVGLSNVRPIAAGKVTTEIITESDLTPVTIIDGSTLTQDITADAGQLSEVKFATLVLDGGGYKFTFSTLHDRSFTDWREYDPASAGLAMNSFVEFAEFNMGAVHTKGRPTYVHSYFSKDSKNLLPGGYYELPPL